MRNSSALSVAVFLACLIASSSFVSATENAVKPSQYFVYVNYPDSVNHETFDDNILSQVLGNMESAKKAVLYHYNTVMSGFAASLTPSQAERIKQNPSVYDVVEAEGKAQIFQDFNSSKRGYNSDFFLRFDVGVIGMIVDILCLWPFC